MATFLSFGTGSLCALLLSVSAVAQDTVCAGSLAAPMYPLLARQAHLTGEIKVQFRISSSRKAQDVKCDGHRLLCDSAKRAVEKTEFAADCAGPLEIHMEFVLEGEPTNETITTVTFRTPNRYLISANPAMLNTNEARPKRNAS